LEIVHDVVAMTRPASTQPTTLGNPSLLNCSKWKSSGICFHHSMRRAGIHRRTSFLRCMNSVCNSWHSWRIGRDAVPPLASPLRPLAAVELGICRRQETPRDAAQGRSLFGVPRVCRESFAQHHIRLLVTLPPLPAESDMFEIQLRAKVRVSSSSGASGRGTDRSVEPPTQATHLRSGSALCRPPRRSGHDCPPGE
jgi:hypothetical protein